MTNLNAAEQKALNAIEKLKSALAEVGLSEVQNTAIEETLSGVATHVVNHAIDRDVAALFPPPPAPEPEQNESISGESEVPDTSADSSSVNA